MAWSYRKRFKVIPGVYLNLSKSGISTSIGVRGAKITFSNSGTYLNTSIPLLGLSNRQKLSSNNPNSNQYKEHQVLEVGNIFSADVQEITTQNMQGVKEAILASHQQRKELKKDLTKTKTTLVISNLKLYSSYILIYGLIKKDIPLQIRNDISSQKDAIKYINEQIENCYVALDIEFDEAIRIQYEKVVSTYKNLATSNKIWDVTNEEHNDTKVTRSAASRSIKKTEVKFGTKSLPDIRGKFEALWFNNANGADLYIYPNFIVMHSSKTKFAVIGLDELDFLHSSTKFLETGSIPNDSKIIDRTWAKVNKNGSPDKRFKDNYEIPVVRYGSIYLKTKTGLNEEFQFSNYEFTEAFGTAFNEYQTTIKKLKQL